jgi:hypothetical protein
MKSLMVIFASALLLATASQATQSLRTVRGTIVGISSDGQSLMVRVPLSVGSEDLWVERTYHADARTPTRSAGRATPFEGLSPGGSAVVTYTRVEGRNVIRNIKLADAGSLGAPSTGEETDNLEDRGRYEESAATMLEVIEEEIQELEHSAETSGVAELARSGALSAELRGKLKDAQADLDSLVGAGSEIAWQGARRDLQTAMADLGAALSRARSQITGR